jgi:hypothetical protein
MKKRFSKRIGLQLVAAEKAIRNDVPEEFRQSFFFVMQNFGLGLRIRVSNLMYPVLPHFCWNPLCIKGLRTT